MIALFITGYLIIGVIVAVLFTERVDCGEMTVLNFLFVVTVWPLVILAGCFQ